ncbi:MAG: hypothetical protein U1E78_09735 [Gammaproteobacteria bacterium]
MIGELRKKFEAPVNQPDDIEALISDFKFVGNGAQFETSKFKIDSAIAEQEDFVLVPESSEDDQSDIETPGMFSKLANLKFW